MKQHIQIAVLQPSYMPWIGYLEQIDYVDHFVFYDDVQYTSRDWRNRNRIKHIDGLMWISVPVKAKYDQKIKDVLIDNSQTWRRKHLNSFAINYRKAPFFEEIFSLFEFILLTEYDKLSDLNIDIIKSIMKYLDIRTVLHKSSELGIEGDQTNRLIEICNHFSATKYYSGKAAKNYLDIKQFEEKNMLVEFQEFIPIAYPQLYGKFEPYVSIVDLLFMCGKESINIIRNSHG